MSIFHSIGKMTDIKELYQARKAIDARINVLHKAHYQKACKERFAKLSTLPVGTLVYCGASGHFLGGNIQRGTTFAITHKAGRKYVWLKRDEQEKTLGYSAQWLQRYEIQIEKPENPVSEKQAANYEKIGAVLTEALTTAGAAE